MSTHDILNTSSNFAHAPSQVNQTLEVLQTEAIHQLEQLYALLGQSIARETRDAAVAAAAAAGSSVLGATLVQQGSNEADKALMEDYRKVGVSAGRCFVCTLFGENLSIGEAERRLSIRKSVFFVEIDSTSNATCSLSSVCHLTFVLQIFLGY